MWNVKSRGLLRATPGSWQVGGRLVSLCTHSFIHVLPTTWASAEPAHSRQQSTFRLFTPSCLGSWASPPQGFVVPSATPLSEDMVAQLAPPSQPGVSGVPGRPAVCVDCHPGRAAAASGFPRGQCKNQSTPGTFLGWEQGLATMETRAGRMSGQGQTPRGGWLLTWMWAFSV